jgi:pre-mRNA-splicing factor ATP-dependent RNA helicase DHX15/PRP43
MNIKNTDPNIGILDPLGVHINPLTSQPYSQTYLDMAKIWSKLPAYDKRTEIIDAIQSNQLVIVVAGTGSGKTVLLPKFALHTLKYNGKVAVTLPKRINTISSSTYAAVTLDITLGKEIGYKHKGSPSSMISSENKIVYMTDGVLKMKLISDPMLSEFNIIIIDEAHERKVQIDMIMLFIKKILPKRPDLKLIIMSATIDYQKYSDYFGDIKKTVVYIPVETNFEVQTIFSQVPIKSFLTEGIDIINDVVSQKKRNDTLFFVTTSNEALQTCHKIRAKHSSVYCVELYSDMDENLKAFATDKDLFLDNNKGKYDRKLVIATNVAESSITINGLKIVIDSCYELFSYYEPKFMMNVLERRLITKAQALQRRGRVGRLEPGICYHLVTKEQFDSLADYPEPDMLKQDITMDLINILIITKSYEKALQMLSELMDKPHPAQIKLATNLLYMYDILNKDGTTNDIIYSLSQFSSLPLNLVLFLLYSFSLHCAKEVSMIVSMVEHLDGKLPNLFRKSDTICESQIKNKDFLNKWISKKGDHLTYLNIYLKYSESMNKKKWCEDNCIRFGLMQKIQMTQRNYFIKLINMHKDHPHPARHETSIADIKKNVLKSLKDSHKHLIAQDGESIYAEKKQKANINKDSVLYKQNISGKKIIYNKLNNITGQTEFSVVTII